MNKAILVGRLTRDPEVRYTPWDTVVCFTYRLNPIKTNDHDKVLDGAKFRLYSDADCKNEVYVKEGTYNRVCIFLSQKGCGIPG